MEADADERSAHASCKFSVPYSTVLYLQQLLACCSRDSSLFV